MAVYNSVGGCGGPFSLVACNDDAGINQSAIATNLLAATSYYIVVWQVSTNSPLAGATAVQLKVSRPQIPANDFCAGAEVIPSAGPFPYLTAVTDTLRATEANDPPDSSCQVPGFRSVWYQFTPALSGDYFFTTTSNTATRVFDTLLAIYTSSGCGGPFTSVACNDDSVGLRASAGASLAAGTSYYIVVWDLEEADPGYNTVQLGVWRPGSPTVATLAASSITSTSIVFNSLIGPNTSNELTRVWFDWGTSASYDSSTPILNLSPNLVNVPLSRTVALTPPANTLYHYRAVAGHSKGTNFGADRTFLWSSSKPHIDTITPQGNGPYRLQLSGNTAQVYQLQASLTLTNWFDLGPATDLGNGSFEFIDFDAVLFQRSFYRVRVP
jgi:hypothetical protein